VLVEYRAQPLAIKPKAKSVFFRKAGDLCFTVFEVWRPEAVQFVFANSAVLVCAKVQFAFDLTRERFICALCYCSQILIRTFFTKCACRRARADVVRETCAMIFDFERTAVFKCPVGGAPGKPEFCAPIDQHIQFVKPKIHDDYT
jgi:hypothetical protein